MSTVIVRVHGESEPRQFRNEECVPSGVLPIAVGQLHHSARSTLGRVDVVDDRDAVGIGELGHGASISSHAASQISLDKLASSPIAR